MESTCERAEVSGNEWREVLPVAFEMGLPSLFGVECLIDRAERGAWGGPWW